MERKITKLVLADLIFVLLLMLSGSISEWSEPLYIIAFVLPAALLIFTERRDADFSLKLSPAGAAATALAAPLLIGGVFLISALTAAFFSLFGVKSEVDLSGNLWLVILEHAVLPAILEELLFRYAPLRILGGMRRGGAVLLTALLFALSHCNLLQLPYALFAGIVFAALDILTGSILPSLILHLLNNLVSIWWSVSVFETAPVPFVAALILLAAVSLIIIFIKRRGILKKISPIISDFRLSAPPISVVIFIVATLAVSVAAVMNL